MAIRKLLLPLTGTAAGEAALTTSLTIARAWDAHVLALHVRVDSRDVAPLAGEGLSGAMIEEMMSATEKESAHRAQAVRAMFDRFVAAHDVALAEPRARTGPSASFQGGISSKSVSTMCWRSRLHLLSCSKAWRVAAAVRAGSSPASRGSACSQAGSAGGK